jgi:hypothetical protein
LFDHGIILLVLSAIRVTSCDDVGVDHLGNHVVKLGFLPQEEAFPGRVGIGNSRSVSDIRTNRGREIT